MNINELSEISNYKGTHVESGFVPRNMELDVNEGDFISILGSQGTGKSTLLHIMSMTDEYPDNEYKLYYQSINNVSNKGLPGMGTGNMGYISQEDTLDYNLTVYENLEKPLIAKNKPVASRRAGVKRMLERFHLSAHQTSFPGQLTPALRRLVMIATALVCNPRLIIADEPTGGLAPGLGKGVMELLKKLNRKGVTIIQTTCSPAEASYGNRIIRLRHQVN